MDTPMSFDAPPRAGAPVPAPLARGAWRELARHLAHHQREALDDEVRATLGACLGAARWAPAAQRGRTSSAAKASTFVRPNAPSST